MKVNFIFFFQAEDGIRDGHVTGVQTCALPILKAIEETLEKLDQIKVVLVESKENAEEIDQFIDDKKSEVDKIFNNIKDLSINVSSRLDEFMTEYTESIEPTVLNEVDNAKNTLAN